ncbi:Protein PLANT CADMIUM RESISTANCE 3, partial [Mucuna pruriens]
MSEKAAFESWSSGLCDCFSDCGNCMLPHMPVPFAGFYTCIYRTKIRRQYGIQGHQCTDFLLSCFCSPCTICQEYRELQARGFDLSAGWEGNVPMRTRGVTAAPAVEGGMSR